MGGFTSRRIRIRADERERTTRRNGIVHYDVATEDIRRHWDGKLSGRSFRSDHDYLLIKTAFTDVDYRLSRMFNATELEAILAALGYLREAGLLTATLVPVRSEGNGNGKTRKRGSCLLCRRNRVLTAHHIIPKSLGGIDGDGNIATLCRPCHNFVEDVIKSMEQRALTEHIPLFYLDYVGLLVAAKIRL